MWGLECSSPWLQTPNFNSLLILDILIFPGEISGSLFVSGKYFGGPYGVVIHTVKGFGIVKKAEIDAFLELLCFLHHLADVGNLISGPSAFSKTSLNIWKFVVHILLKPGLENLEHYFTSV